MQCNEFNQVAEQWLEGERPAEAQAHVNGCARCRTIVAELEAIAAVGREIGAEEVEAPERVWVSLRNQLESEGLIRTEVMQPALSPQSRTEAFRGLFEMLRRPALGLAYAGALALAVMILPVTNDDVKYGVNTVSPISEKIGAIEKDVRKVLAGSLAQRNPVVAVTYRENLAIVDKFIVLCEKTVRENPNDSMARDYLLQAYQQKAELLSTLAERGVGD
jgi:hypothetical protein